MSNEISSIPDIPKIPNEIKEAVDNGNLAVFIGAGVSRLVGCDGWDVLAQNLVDRCHQDGIINFKEHETISKIYNHKKTITICFSLFTKNNREDAFYDEMNKSLKEDAALEIPNIYDEIYKLRGLFVTTNADTHFDRLFNKPNIYYQLHDFTKDGLDKTNLYHIHGSVKARESLVFTIPAYMKRYMNIEIDTSERSAATEFRAFLEKIFKEYTVLFLGYGVEEFEILDFMFRGNHEGQPPKHFMLSPFYKGEDNILRYEQEYYRALGITLLGYEKDIKGYKQLIDIIKYWNKEINQITGYLHSISRLIDEAVE